MEGFIDNSYTLLAFSANHNLNYESSFYATEQVSDLIILYESQPGPIATE